MQINAVQNINNINFSAKLNLIGYTEDIPKDWVKSLQEKAGTMGKDADVINIKLLVPSSPQSMLRKGKKELHRLERFILGWAELNGGKIIKKSFIGYKTFCPECTEEEFLTKSLNLTKKNINKYFDKLKKAIG